MLFLVCIGTNIDWSEKKQRGREKEREEREGGGDGDGGLGRFANNEKLSTLNV